MSVGVAMGRILDMMMSDAPTTVARFERLLVHLGTRARVEIYVRKVIFYIPYEDDDAVFNRLEDEIKYFGLAGVQYEVLDDLLFWQCRWPWRRVQFVDRRLG